MIRVRGAIAVAAVAACLLPASALAARAPSPDELVELASATGPPTDPACVEGRISTLDARWAVLRAVERGDCPPLVRTWVLRRDAVGARWRELRQAARFDLCARDLPGIPDAVGVELAVCAPPSRRVYVPQDGRFALKPRTLRYSRHATIVGLRWTRWGGRVATGRGTFVYRDAYGRARARVVVTLSGIELCGATRAYLMRRLAPVRRRDAAVVRAYAGAWTVRCPSLRSPQGGGASAARYRRGGTPIAPITPTASSTTTGSETAPSGVSP